MAWSPGTMARAARSAFASGSGDRCAAAAPVGGAAKEGAASGPADSASTREAARTEEVRTRIDGIDDSGFGADGR